MIEAVLWDFGGVITSSPFEAFNRMEAEKSLPHNLVRKINSTNPDTNAWAKFERSEISVAEFDTLFAEEATAQGHDLRGNDVLACLAGDLRPEMVKALNTIAAKYKTACITNNVNTGAGPGMARSEEKANAIAHVMETFDHIIESSKAGIRKPDPRIYQMACEAIGVAPANCIYLDDLGINCKPAAALGMKAIKVTSADQALDDLGATLDMDLRA
ncbi:MAG: HAD-IA family hydrolase [Alphaproteobacteria bacterium]